MLEIPNKEIKRRAYGLRLLAFDVDGVFTEGELTYIGESQETRRFYAHDGIGIMMAKLAGLQIALITGKNTPMVQRRAEELKIDEVLQGFTDKEEGMRQLCSQLDVLPEQIAYVGDDIHDIPAMKGVGLPIAVANARPEVKEHAAYVTQAAGGAGAVREVVEWVLGLRGEKQAVEEEFSLTSTEKANAARDGEKIVVHFGSENVVLDCFSRLPSDFTFITGDKGLANSYNLRRVRSLVEYHNPHFGAEANQLLLKLNTLTDASGRRYSSIVEVDGYETWWFLQEQSRVWLHEYCRYRPLMERLAQAALVTIHECPEDLLRALSLYSFPNTKVTIATTFWHRPKRLIARALFAGLRIFRRTLSTVSLGWAMVRHPHVLIFSSDIITPGKTYDARIEKAYSAVATSGVRYLEFFGSHGSKSIRNAFKRKRFALYRDYVPTWFHFSTNIFHRTEGQESFGIEGDTPDETALHRLASQVIVPDSHRSAQMVKSFSSIVKLVKPRCAVFIDDGRYVHELVAACRINKILTYGLQHGTHCCMTPAFRANGFQEARNHAFDHFLLWSPFFVEYMNKCSSILSHANMQVGGLPKGRIRINNKRSMGITAAHPKARVMFVIEDYDRDIQDAEVFLYLKKLAEDPRIDLTLKLRAGQEKAPFSAMGVLGMPQEAVLSGPIDPLFEEMDVVIGSWSTAILDSIYHRIPLVLFSTSQYDDPLGLAVVGVASKVSRPDDIVETVLGASRIPIESLIQYKKIIWGEGDIDTAEFLVENAIKPSL